MLASLPRALRAALALLVLAAGLLPEAEAARIRIRPRLEPKVRVTRSALTRRGVAATHSTRVLRRQQTRVNRTVVRRGRQAGLDAPSRRTLVQQGLSPTQADRVVRKRLQASAKQADLAAKQQAARAQTQAPPKRVTGRAKRKAKKEAKLARRKQRLVDEAGEPPPGTGKQVRSDGDAEAAASGTAGAEWVDPRDLNFAQRSVNRRFRLPDGSRPQITQVARKGPAQVEDFPPLLVQEKGGKLVVREGNRRLWVARQTKAKRIKVIRETPEMPGYGDLHKRTSANGLPVSGTPDLPTPR